MTVKRRRYLRVMDTKHAEVNEFLEANRHATLEEVKRSVGVSQSYAYALMKKFYAARADHTAVSGISDGSTADYYVLPASAKELQDLISHKNMNAQIGEIFRSCYRFGEASHSNQLRDAKKIKFYIDAEVSRLEGVEG